MTDETTTAVQVPSDPLKLPLKLKPRFVQRLWGGGALPAFHGATGADKPLEAADTPIGESWLLGDDNEIAGGPLNGRLLKDLAERYGAELLGTANTERYGNKLALLAKFLDAKLDLSVQVHPDDAYALSHERESGHLGKAEAWYVLTAEPGASVLWGFARDATAAVVRSAIQDGRLESLLNRLPVSAGDVVVNPAGMVHAVGAGVMLFEIQQASDLTYRLYDYDRRDAEGKPRELHIEKSLDVAQLARSDVSRMPGRVRHEPLTAESAAAAQPQRQRGGSWRRLVEVPEFVMDVVELGGDHAEGDADVDAEGVISDATSAESLELLVLTRGEVTVCAKAAGGAAKDVAETCVTMRRSDAVLLAATLGSYTISGSGEVLRCAIVKAAGS